MRSLDEIRDTLLVVPESVSDSELLGVFLGRGARVATREDARKNLSAVKVGHELLADVSLDELLRRLRTENAEALGIGPFLGSRLLALRELVMRYDRRPSAAGELTLKFDAVEVKPQSWKPERQAKRWAYKTGMRQRLFDEGPEAFSEGELLALVIGDSRPELRAVERIAATGVGVGDLVRTLDGDGLGRWRLGRSEGCRLIAACEIARRFHRLASGRLHQVISELPLSMLAFGEQLLRALARHPEPRLVVQGAELFRLARRLTAEMVTERRTEIPDLDALRQVLEGGGDPPSPGQPSSPAGSGLMSRY